MSLASVVKMLVAELIISTDTIVRIVMNFLSLHNSFIH